MKIMFFPPFFCIFFLQLNLVQVGFIVLLAPINVLQNITCVCACMRAWCMYGVCMVCAWCVHGACVHAWVRSVLISAVLCESGKHWFWHTKNPQA